MVVKAKIIRFDCTGEEDDLNHWFSNNQDKKVIQILQKEDPEFENTYLATIIYEEL